MPRRFKAGDEVTYIPGHAHGDRSHPDCEHGRVSSVGPTGLVFVKFQAKVNRYGWDRSPAEACDPEDLVSRQAVTR